MIEAALWIAILGIALLVLFFAFLFLRLALPRRRLAKGIPPVSISLSILICAHDEADNLRRNLPAVLNQDYFLPDGAPAFEVIVVNDASTDESAALLDAFAAAHSHMRIIHIAASEARRFPGKKFPLSRGLEAAAHSHIVCTDADCQPVGRHWLREMAAPLAQGKKIVAGYGGFFIEKGWLNAFIRHETANTFMQYSAFSRAGFPYMAVGRNLAATKAAFLEAQQSEAWSQLPSGDDDLLVQHGATAGNMAIADQPESFTFSEAKKQLGDYLAQKRRHVSTAKFYSRRSKLLPGAYALMHGCWWLLLIAALAVKMPASAIFVLLAPMLLLMLVQYAIARRLQARTSLGGWLLFSLGWVLYNAVLAPYILWKTRQRWT
jgi:cellulose synthase/poly-beta-1,6-N-acetylglucosamine synthase-like glycosyltransferase